MTRRSLRLRLSLAAAVLIALALVLGGIGLVFLFDRALDRRASDELAHVARFLAGQVGEAPDGQPTLATSPADARFDTPYSGLYWQIEGAQGQRLRSRSLWDKTLRLPDEPRPGLPRVLDLAGPDGGTLIAVRQRLELADAARPPLTIVVALDRRELAESRAGFVGLLVPSLVALGLILVCAMSAFVHIALRPFRLLRADLAAVHRGERNALPGYFPDEVQPLVEDLNHLIRVQDAALVRARTEAGDLAHGLKTPLAVLVALARRVSATQPALSVEIEEQARALQGQVERALARARVAATGGLHRRHCRVGPPVRRLVAALQKLPCDRLLEWDVRIADAALFPGGEDDLTEIAGNVVDNARTWARSQIRISTETIAGTTALVIEDDGPGMSAEEIAAVARGQRRDETQPGSGFGLAITRDAVDAAGGRMELARSVRDGLRVALIWPRPEIRHTRP